ncbi:MAG TPA: hypothetical protein ENI99_05755 [Sedimenticola sp.]|nr:hypothetical protein [Sedimenticola sp.]
MKRIVIVGMLLLGWGMGDAVAGCGATQITDLQPKLSGQLIDGSAGSNRWQEVHCANGDLWELAKGPSDPIDPTHKVGTWYVESGGTRVCYAYPSGTYCFTVHSADNTNYSFCNGGSEAATGTLTAYDCPQ